ncbi:MAG: hypothetical protein H7251_09500 [Acetobacteraceae bacterium]|nr:hypothetical protein [Acetobacteraceae bacterium]
MNSSVIPFGLPDTAPELARRFAMIMAGLGALVARRFIRMPHLVGLTLLLWGRLNRAVRRFHRALTVAAKVGAPRVRAVRAAATRVRSAELPRGKGWIVRELGWEAAAYLAQLEALLAEIGTQAAIAASPGAGRVLRPICRMLGMSAAVAPKILPATREISVVASSQPMPAGGLWVPGGAGVEMAPILGSG